MKRQPCLVAILLVIITTTAPAQTIEDHLAVCAGELEPGQRLACFDALVEDMGIPGKQVIEKQDLKTAVKVPDSANAQFGLEHKTTKGQLVAEMEARVIGVYKNKLGKLLLILDNGQIWQQMDSKPMIIHEGDAAIVERGALSAFYLTGKGKKQIRVTRVK